MTRHAEMIFLAAKFKKRGFRGKITSNLWMLTRPTLMQTLDSSTATRIFRPLRCIKLTKFAQLNATILLQVMPNDRCKSVITPTVEALTYSRRLC